MAGAVGNSFYDSLLKAMLAGGAVPGGYELRLFTNSPSISKTSVPTDFTEASGSGYAAKAIAANAFTVSLVGSVEKATLGSQVFNFTGAITINGYYVTDSGGTVFYWGESGGPFAFGAAGGTLGVSLEIDGP